MIEQKIPKIINYCWFGGKEKPADVVAYIETWKKWQPDYQIIEWNEQNFDISQAVPYVKEAYEAKKWAFVSDYVRLYALKQNGGIYFDTDVEVFKAFDPLLDNEAFFGFESKDYLTTSVMGAVPNHWFICEFLQSYDERLFILDDGTLDTETTNVVVLTKLLKKYGLKLNGKAQMIEGMRVYPQQLFCANNFRNIFGKYRKSSYSYHHCSASWYDAHTSKGMKNRIRHYVLNCARNIFGTATLYNLRHKG